MELGDYINHLIFISDKIAIPDLGMLVSKQHSAYFNKSVGTIEPPKTLWDFEQENPKVSEYQQLVSFVSKGEKCSQEEALKKIKDKVESWKEQLKEGKHVKISDSDFLYFSKAENTTKYMSLRDKQKSCHFGLKPVSAKEFQRTSLVQQPKVEKKYEYNFVPPPKSTVLEEPQETILPDAEEYYREDQQEYEEDYIEESTYDPEISLEPTDTTLILYKIGWIVAVITIVTFVVFILQFNDVINFYKIFQ